MTVKRESSRFFDWAQKLGLSASPLFGFESQAPKGHHYALLNGVRGSFLLSSEVDQEESLSKAPDWAWSSYVRHHVSITNGEVTVRRAAIGVDPDIFTRQTVEKNLETFFQFLELDERVPTINVVEHIVSIFRMHREELRSKELRSKELNTEHVLSSFLFLLSTFLEEHPDDVLLPLSDAQTIITKYDLDAIGVDEKWLTDDYRRRFSEQLRFNNLTERELELGLAIRHAGGALFQEAHAEISSAPIQLTLYGLPASTKGKIDFSTGAYFTPPGLARSVAEICIQPHLSDASLKIVDPACGSGIFLCEVIRALQREKYQGTIRLVGMDISPAAVQMARFALACARMDWPGKKIEFKISRGDFLKDELLLNEFDVLLMNPPFRPWQAMEDAERQQVKKILGQLYSGRPNLSMVFVLKAIDKLRTGGTLGTLLPVGVLASESARKWRSALLERGRIEFLSALGNHCLFRYATVNVAAGVFRKGIQPDKDHQLTMLWASEKPRAGSEALRAVRIRRVAQSYQPTKGQDWNVYTISSHMLQRRPLWLPMPNALGAMLEEIESVVPTRVHDFFNVRQGVRTGYRDAFVISDNDFCSLPNKEQKYFRPIVETASIVDGQIKSDRFLFYPNLQFSSEEELKATCPTFFNNYMLPHKQKLIKRRGIKRGLYWELTRPRQWLQEFSPRLASKMYATTNGFALDVEGKFVVVRGYGWLPKWRAIGIPDDQDLRVRVLRLYMFLLNSEIFYILSREFSTNVAGGQLDLANKYIAAVPLPNLFQLLEKSQGLTGRAKQMLDTTKDGDIQPIMEDRNLFAAMAFGTDLRDWPLGK